MSSTYAVREIKIEVVDDPSAALVLTAALGQLVNKVNEGTPIHELHLTKKQLTKVFDLYLEVYGDDYE